MIDLPSYADVDETFTRQAMARAAGPPEASAPSSTARRTERPGKARKATRAEMSPSRRNKPPWRLRRECAISRIASIHRCEVAGAAIDDPRTSAFRGCCSKASRVSFGDQPPRLRSQLNRRAAKSLQQCDSLSENGPRTSLALEIDGARHVSSRPRAPGSEVRTRESNSARRLGSPFR